MNRREGANGNVCSLFFFQGKSKELSISVLFISSGKGDTVNIKNVQLKDIKPYEKNARDNKNAVEKVTQSIKEFGFKVPIVLDKNNVIVCGHTRYEAAKKLKMAAVPCVIADDLTENQIKAYRLADNKVAEFSTWDFDILKDELFAIDDIDMSDFGFDLSFGDDEEQEVQEDDYITEIPKEPKAKLGDIYQLGRHRLMCGDSTDKETVALLMNGNKADIAFTSPPYNAGSLNIVGNETTKAKYNSYDDNKTELDYFDFIKTNLSLLLDNANEVFYNIGLVENNKRPIIMLQNEFIDKFKDIIYWEKSTVAPHIQNGVINNLVEFILCFGNGKRKFENAQFSQGTYWNVIKGANASGHEYSKIHKATFPVYLPSNIIENFSPKTGTVVDCFGGTGTTLIACEQLNRTCYMMELDPKYCDVIIKRWEKFTGEKAVLLNDDR